MKTVQENIALVLVTLIVAAAIVACFYIGYDSNNQRARICGQLMTSGTVRTTKECP